MPYPRISGIIAAEANVAVVFRRGPSRHTLQLLWDMDSDVVTPGQWIKAKVYTKRCDISADGRYLVGAFLDYSSTRANWSGFHLERWQTSGWTAISRPPYFTALALWFSGGAWNGGGMWTGPKSLRINNFAYQWIQAKKPHWRVRVSPMNLPGSEDEPMFGYRLEKRGWKRLRDLRTELTNPGWRERSARFIEAVRDMMTTGHMLGPASLDDIVPRYRTLETGLWVKEFAGGRLVREEGREGDVWSACDGEGTPILTLPEKKWQPRWLPVGMEQLSPGRIKHGRRPQRPALRTGLPSSSCAGVVKTASSTATPVPLI